MISWMHIQKNYQHLTNTDVNLMKKIKKLKLMPIFEGKAIYEENGQQIQAISIGAGIEIRKADGASALFIDAIAGNSVRYNKIEEKDLEIETLQNELAGIVGQFDGQVHKLMAKYGYEWVSPEDAITDPTPISTMESVNEASHENPVGTWIGDYFITEVLTLNQLVDSAAENFDFGDDQKMENRFRAKIAELLKEGFDLSAGPASRYQDLVAAFMSDLGRGELDEFQDYYTG